MPLDGFQNDGALGCDANAARFQLFDQTDACGHKFLRRCLLQTVISYRATKQTPLSVYQAASQMERRRLRRFWIDLALSGQPSQAE
jgi:hypothetical protein